MGEIADALKRAGETKTRSPARAPAGRDRSDGPIYSRAIDVEAAAAEQAAVLVDESENALDFAIDPAADEARHTIPVDQREHWVSRAVLVAPNGPAAECFRHLAIGSVASSKTARSARCSS